MFLFRNAPSTDHNLPLDCKSPLALVAFGVPSGSVLRSLFRHCNSPDKVSFCCFNWCPALVCFQQYCHLYCDTMDKIELFHHSSLEIKKLECVFKYVNTYYKFSFRWYSFLSEHLRTSCFKKKINPSAVFAMHKRKCSKLGWISPKPLYRTGVQQ